MVRRNEEHDLLDCNKSKILFNLLRSFKPDVVRGRDALEASPPLTQAEISEQVGLSLPFPGCNDLHHFRLHVDALMIHSPMCWHEMLSDIGAVSVYRMLGTRCGKLAFICIVAPAAAFLPAPSCISSQKNAFLSRSACVASGPLRLAGAPLAAPSAYPLGSQRQGLLVCRATATTSEVCISISLQHANVGWRILETGKKSKIAI